MAAATSVKLVIPSEVRLVDLVHTVAEKLSEIVGLDEEDGLNAALAVREALINAIVHGNRSDPALDVEVTLVASAEGLEAKVVDRGRGFDPVATPDPTVGDNRLRTSGRGLLLIRAFVDDVRFRYLEGRGMEVTLIKAHHPPRGAGEDRSYGPAIPRRT
ncbi:MAG: ATP-binding protein [Acidobacteriia bacterium]|nr:ATP-binding protein [Terriglobia bacterium]